MVSELTSVLNAMNTTDMAPWGAASLESSAYLNISPHEITRPNYH